MKLFIAIDLEGICGVVSEADTAREGAAAQRARAHMRADLDAVLAGCAAAGADEVVVCDAHDDGRNLDPAGLPGWVTLVSGSPTPGSMLEGLAPDCDAALFVGYHGRAGTLGAVLEHTWSYKTYSVAVGDLEVGEFGVAALLAGEMGVPAVYVSGDDKVVAEAGTLVPGIFATVVKEGVRREAAGFFPPEEARARMTRDVEAALTGEVPAGAAAAGAASPCASPSPACSSATSPRSARAPRAWTGARWRSPATRSRRSTGAFSPACGSRKRRAERRPRRSRPCGRGDRRRVGADDGTRTRDLQLGKLTCYQLHHIRSSALSDHSGGERRKPVR